MASFAGGASSLLFSVFFLLAASASARPGVPFHPFNAHIVTYTISTTGDHHVSRSVSILRIITPARTFDADPHSAMNRRPEFLSSSRELARPDPAAFGFSSLRERAKDILVVVIGLLFGVGCGALTAATMYLAWSLVTYRYEICGSDAYSDEEEEMDESPKKAGYAKIPATDISVKEGYEHN
ncbi:uncharacterized protein LOC122010536 [Zingiber officinale]|uniref:Transmembrane protein n=1 Tax=Zingiber officinale TaxID=94328 RepID=A0A8J5HVT9_ZINOF|nr:uncharacterized protein LOC122010536 [Zingiber officinale]KAG6534308.1 hypothetical protein ZIOFF_008194 [Zingiber officinale]